MGEYFPVRILIMAFYTEKKNQIVVDHCKNDVFMIFTFVKLLFLIISYRECFL